MSTKDTPVVPETSAAAIAVAAQKQSLVAVGSSIPDYIAKSQAPSGKENLTLDDARIPRLALAQPQTPQVIKGDPTQIQGLTVGQAFNDLTEEIYGDGPLNIIVVQTNKPRFVEFGDDRSVIDPNVAPGDPRTLFRSDPTDPKKRLRPVATQFYDYVVVIVHADGRLEPLSYSFKGSGIKIAKRLNGFILMKPIPVFACLYRFTPTYNKNDQGFWYSFAVHQLGFLSPELFEAGEKLYNQFKDKTVSHDVSAPVGPTDDAPGLDDPNEI
jgi:hypothetical protein